MPKGDIIGERPSYSTYYLETCNSTITNAVVWNNKYTNTENERYFDLMELVRLIIARAPENMKDYYNIISQVLQLLDD